MKRLLITTLLISPLTFTQIPVALGVDINCQSSVWRNHESCEEKKPKKPFFCNESVLTPIQEEECLSFEEKIKNKISSPLEYPIAIGSNEPTNYVLREYLAPDGNSSKWRLSMNEILQIRSKTGKNLEIAFGKQPFARWAKFKEKRSFQIKTSDIIAWQKNGSQKTSATGAQVAGTYALLFNPVALFIVPFGITTYKTDVFQIIYLDKYGEPNNFFIIQENPHISKGNLVVRFLEKITSLKEGDIRSDEELKPKLELSLENLYKESERLKNILKVPNSSKSNCLELKHSQYPSLIKKYEKINKSIENLSNRLNTKPNIILEKVCPLDKN